MSIALSPSVAARHDAETRRCPEREQDDHQRPERDDDRRQHVENLDDLRGDERTERVIE